jgi:hypothetical protein
MLNKIHRITIRLTTDELQSLRSNIGLRFTSLSALVRSIHQYITMHKAVV